MHLVRAELSPFSGRQVVQAKVGDPNSSQAFCLITESLQHSPNLAIEPLLQHNLQPRWRNSTNVYCARAFPIHDDAPKKSLGQAG
jgi:hypothetical protein